MLDKFGENILDNVQTLTKTKRESKDEQEKLYVAQVLDGSKLCRTVKIVDRILNIMDDVLMAHNGKASEFTLRYMTYTYKYYLKIFESLENEYPEFIILIRLMLDHIKQACNISEQEIARIKAGNIVN